MTAQAASAVGSMATLSWRALGTSAFVCAPRQDLFAAHRAAARAVDVVDGMASRFRAGSELSRLNASAGEWTAITPDLADLVDLGIRAAEVSGGAVDPTLARELEQLGYDRDFADLAAVDRAYPPSVDAEAPVADRGRPWRDIELTDEPGMIRLPTGIGLDLGATAKGRAADLAAAAAHQATGGAVLVSLGGDVSVAGAAPESGWAIAIADDHARSPRDCEEAVSIRSGGLATSSLLVRRWWHDGAAVHHVLDPRTGSPVSPHWTAASVLAATCAEANVAATASLVLGPKAVCWLDSQNLPARLVATDGTVTRLNGWPT